MLQRTWQKMRMPVGLWNRSTAVSTLFTFWPPAPLARAVLRSMSCEADRGWLLSSQKCTFPPPLMGFQCLPAWHTQGFASPPKRTSTMNH